LSSTGLLVLIEGILVFGAVIGWAIWELASLRKTKPPEAGGVREAGRRAGDPPA